MTYPSIQSLLKKYSIKPKKRLGQNFLIATPTAQKICNSLELSKQDTVIEIGPGLLLGHRSRPVPELSRNGNGVWPDPLKQDCLALGAGDGRFNPDPVPVRDTFCPGG